MLYSHYSVLMDFDTQKIDGYLGLSLDLTHQLTLITLQK